MELKKRTENKIFKSIYNGRMIKVMADLLNLDNETLRTLITCCTTVLVALISNILVFAVTKINNKTDKKNSISEEQYTKIFAPIHKLIYFNMDTVDNDELKYELIEKIISDNYHIVPVNIRNKYMAVQDVDSAEEFEKSIDIVFRYLSSVLGYSKEKLSIKERKQAKKILNRKSEYLEDENTIKFYIFGLILNICALIGNIYFPKPSDNTSHLISNLIMPFVCIVLAIIIFIVDKILSKRNI